MPAPVQYPGDQQPTSSTMYRVAGRTYPMKVVNGCTVCNSPWRTALENYIILGASFESAVSEIDKDAGITKEMLKRHFAQKHLPLLEEARRAIIERRATELHWDVDTEAQNLIDHTAFLRLGLNDVSKRMLNREIQPDVKDGIAMARVLAQIDIDKETEDNLGMFVQGIKVLLETARRYMSVEVFARFSQEVLEDPAIQAIANNMPEHRAPTRQSSALAIEAGEAP